MKSHKNLNRKSIRLSEYDYSQQGAYFLTIVTHKRKCMFGEILSGEIQLNKIGSIVDSVWLSIPDHFPHVTAEIYQIMPNHIHGIIVIETTLVGARHAVPLPGVENFGKPIRGSIPTIVRSFKSEVTRRVNIIKNTPGKIFWQRNYYEHVIRNDEDYQRIFDYISSNPLNWAKDPEFTDIE